MFYSPKLDFFQPINTYPSMTNLWNGADLSHTGQFHVGFFSFIIKNVVASKHCKCEHVPARHGICIRIFPSCLQKEKKKEHKCLPLVLYNFVLKSGSSQIGVKMYLNLHREHTSRI